MSNAYFIMIDWLSFRSSRENYHRLIMMTFGDRAFRHLGTVLVNIAHPHHWETVAHTNCQRHLLASSDHLELGMFDAAALGLEEIAPR